MRSFLKTFAQRGLCAAAGGPVVMAIVYLCLHAAGAVESIDAVKVAVEILTVTLLAFIAAGITAIYKVERLPLAAASMIQLAVLYADYILIYLFNGWLKTSAFAIGIFTGVFIVGYAVIWCIILLVNRHKVAEMNRKMQNS